MLRSDVSDFNFWGLDDEEKDKKLFEATNPELFKVEKSYKGLTITLPLRSSQVEAMIEHFKMKKVFFNGLLL